MRTSGGVAPARSSVRAQHPQRTVNVREVTVPRTSSKVSLPFPAYDEQPDWSELWEACVVVLDQNPHLRPPASTSYPVSRRVRIPQEAVDASDVHYHLD